MSTNANEEVTLDIVVTELDTNSVDSGQTNVPVRNEVTDVVVVATAIDTKADADTTKLDSVCSDPIVSNSESDRIVTDDHETKNDINDNRVVEKKDDTSIDVTLKKEDEKEQKVSTAVVSSSSDDSGIPMNVWPLPIPTVRIKVGSGKERKAIYKLVVEKPEVETAEKPVDKGKKESDRNEDSGIEATTDANGSIEMELDSEKDDDGFEATPTSTSNNDPHDLTTEEGRRLYVVKCIDILASKRDKLSSNQIKKMTPFQYFCQHVDRPLLYSIFGNTIDGYSCPLCQHFHRLLPAFLFHMRTHKDITTLLELYVNIGGKLVNLDRALSRIKNYSRRRSRARRAGTKFTIRKRRDRKIPKKFSVEMDCSMPALEREDKIDEIVAESEPPMMVVDDTAVKTVAASTVPPTVEAKMTLDEWAKKVSSILRFPDLPRLDVADDCSMNSFVKIVCDHIAKLRLKYMTFRKNITLFEILCRFLERPLLYDVFRSGTYGFRCPCCHHFCEKLKYMMSHARGHRDLELILELYLRRGGEFDFKEREQPRRRKPKVLAVRETVKVTVSNVRRTYRKRVPWKIATERLQVNDCRMTDSASKEDLETVSNLDSKSSKVTPKRRRLPTKLISKEVVKQRETVDSEVPTSSLEPDTSKTGNGLLEKVKRRDGFCVKALQPKTYNMLRGIVSRRISKANPHYCLSCGKIFQSCRGLYIHYYRHEIKEKMTQNKNNVVQSRKGPSTSVVRGRKSSEFSSSEDLPLVSKKKFDVGDVEDSSVADEHENDPDALGELRKRRKYSTKSSRAKTLYMFNGILTEKITRENPHYCKFCGHPFYSGQGVYKHYLLHTKAPMKKTVVGTSRSRATSRVTIEEHGTETARNEKSTQFSTPPQRNTRKTSDVNNQHDNIMNQNKKSDEENHLKERNDTTTKEITNPSLDLDPETVNMLKEILKNKITFDNPHYCLECGHRFNSGCGLYSHYYVHFTQEKGKKKKQSVIVTDQHPIAATSQNDDDVESMEASSNGDGTAIGTDASQAINVVPTTTPRRRNRGNSTRPKKFVPAVYLDAKTYLLLRRIAKETTPDNPHLCMICNHSFHDGRGIYSHYNRHARQNTNNAGFGKGSLVAKKKQLPAAEFGTKVGNLQTSNVRPNKIVETKQKPTKKVATMTTTTEKNDLQNKFCPMKALHKSTLNMLQGVIKRKITPENPHHCTFCSKLFFSGTGIYFHYLKHWKQSDNPIVTDDNGSMPGYSAAVVDSKSVPTPHYGQRSVATNNHHVEDIEDYEEKDKEAEEQELVLCELEHNTKTLLYCLTRDALVLKDLGWPHRDAVEVVADILNICNVVPFGHCGDSNSEKLHCLRNNVHRLIRFCISDEAMTEHGWSYKLVDDAVKEIIASDENFSIF